MKQKSIRKGLVFIKKQRKGYTTIWCGTLDELENQVFGYTLECGHSWNPRIPRYPKSKQSLENALNNSATEINDYDSYYSLATKEEYLTNGGEISESRYGYVYCK